MSRLNGLQQYTSAPIPAAAGIGLRPEHYPMVLEGQKQLSAAWLEVHPENYFGLGGEPLRALEAARARHPLSLHGVGLSIGSTDPLDQAHLSRLKGLVNRFQPGLVSEHLAWGSVEGVYFNDLLPLPYTEEALLHVSERVQRVQERLSRSILLENPSTYLQFADSCIPEPEFLAEVARRTGCGILLDVNNVYVQACNHGLDAEAYLDAIPAGLVQEIHLAGHTERQFEEGKLLIDTHDQPVSTDVWQLFERVIQRIGPRPTLIEWDSDLPAFKVLEAEAVQADRILGAHRAVLA